jgi:chemotaxis-related protein WspB
MLMLLLKAGDETYAMEAGRVIEVVPMVETHPLPHAPGQVASHVAGVINYHGTVVPLIDLSLLMWGQACRRRMSTRIILVRYDSADGLSQVVGLRAERVTETVCVRKEDFIPGNASLAATPFVDGAIMHGGRIIACLRLDRLRLDRLLSESMRLSLSSDSTGDA